MKYNRNKTDYQKSTCFDEIIVQASDFAIKPTKISILRFRPTKKIYFYYCRPCERYYYCYFLGILMGL